MRGLAFLLLAGCSNPSPNAPDRPTTSRPSLNGTASPTPAADEARLVAEASCGRCHNSYYPTAIPGAVAIFDILDPDWPDKLTAEQLDSSLVRILSAHDDPEGHPTLTGEDVAAFTRFVEERKAQPVGPSR